MKSALLSLFLAKCFEQGLYSQTFREYPQRAPHLAFLLYETFHTESYPSEEVESTLLLCNAVF